MTKTWTHLQPRLLGHLDQHRKATVDTLAIVAFNESAWWSRSRVVESIRLMEKRGLVKMTGPSRPSGRRVVRRLK